MGRDALVEKIAEQLAVGELDDEQTRLRKLATRDALKKGIVTLESVGAELALEKIAEEIRKQHPEMSAEGAYGRALGENPELYTAYRDGRDC